MGLTLTIVGSGATALTAVHYFTQKGIDTLLCDTEERKYIFENIRKQGISVKGTTSETKSMPLKMTTNFSEAVKYADNILLCVAADRQTEIARQLAPYVEKKHSILLSPGNCGSPLLRKVLGEDVLLGELSDNLWPCRMTGQAEVLVGLPLKEKYVAAYPAENTKELMKRWGMYLELREGKNILETALNSPNVVSHVAGAVLNTAAIEQKQKEFALFEDGLSLGVIRVLGKVEEERNQVLRKMGLSVYQSTVPLLYSLYRKDNKEMEIFRRLDGPSSMSHRYISEDAQCGVSLLLSLADVYKVEMPVTKAVLCLAECINEKQYFMSGRTLENLHICVEAV